MATMVKEKCKEKKRKREKPSHQLDTPLSETENIGDPSIIDGPCTSTTKKENFVETLTECLPTPIIESFIQDVKISTENTVILSNNEETQSCILNSPECDKPIEQVKEAITPSAPVLEEVKQEISVHRITLPKEVKPKMQCVSLEEAVRLYGGKEMMEVKGMSEKEEMLVEAGPVSGPEHPLVDLLSTFRCSLMALERERSNVAQSLDKEQKRRSALWKIEKRFYNDSEKCPCGAYVTFKASYDHAELQKEKLAVAKMGLESLLRDVQESYCHHQHSALLTYYQIEEQILETAHSGKNEIREALSLILQALRLSDTAPAALASALLRWASSLAAALVDGRDLRQLLFLLHHMFRQSRSVRWATRFVNILVGDSVEAARAIALIDLMLVGPRLAAAVECTEEVDELWEEVDDGGGSGAVCEGALRERDLLGLLHALPLRDLVARLALFTHRDVSVAHPYEWCAGAGGRGVVHAAYGVRALCSMLQRAATKHTRYVRLRRRLHELALHALHALALLHLHNRESYCSDLEDSLAVELEACFVSGVQMLDACLLPSVPGVLLRADAASHYCAALCDALHEKSVQQIACLSLELPAIACSVRVRIVSKMAAEREHDTQLAGTVLNFLLMTGLKHNSTVCKDHCDAVARECVPELLSAHPYLYPVALHAAADIHRVDMETSGARPGGGEARALFDEWSIRCTHLLRQFDYTPHTGLALHTQLTIGSWLCGFFSTHPDESHEWAWQELRRLRVHRTCWNIPMDAPPPPHQPKNLFENAYFTLSTSWGHSIPLICEYGAPAICRLITTRPRDAVHCLAPIMLVMANSPESVSLTPRFNDLFHMLLASGPTLVQRALGRGGDSGPTLLLRLIMAQLGGEKLSGMSRGPVLGAWLHALWRSTLPAPALALLDAAALACREWPTIDAFFTGLLQKENAKEHILHATRNVHTAPLLCECALRVAHAEHEARPQLFARLLQELLLQQRAKKKINVDNALKKIGASISSEELVIYRAATAAMSAPAHHPSHLALWRLFMHLYLQPLAVNLHEMTPAGPLLFSGLVKSRTLSQIKKRIQEIITYHQNETKVLNAKDRKTEENHVPTQSSNGKVPNTSANTDVLQTLSLVDLTGLSSESDTETDSSDDEREETIKEREVTGDTPLKRDEFNLLCYHFGAEKLMREYLQWLEAGDRIKVPPHNADLARTIPEQALTAAWSDELMRQCPPPTEDEGFPLPSEPLPSSSISLPTTPFEKVVKRILSIKNRTRRRRSMRQTQSLIENIDFNNSRVVLAAIDNHLKDVQRLVQEWCNETWRVSALDCKLWELVAVLRVPRALPPITRACTNKCRPLTHRIQDQEWCISTGAEREIKENRMSARAALRRLARPRPHAARTAAALLAIARRVRIVDAVSVAERAWRCACAPAAQCPPAQHVLTTLITNIADKWLCGDVSACMELLARWSAGAGAGGGCELQQALCGALVSPQRLRYADRPPLYAALLRACLPDHVVFSHLSKFEVGQWAEQCEANQRREVLDSLAMVAQRWGPKPGDEHSMLLELVGIHSALLTNAHEVCAQTVRYSRSSADAYLPPAHWTHVLQATHTHAQELTCDQLGHLMREIGVIWWEARGRQRARQHDELYAEYAPHVASLLHTLQRAFVAAAVGLSYDPNRVGWLAWSTLMESWSPWVSPRSGVHARALLPLDSDVAADMIRHFLDNAHQVMLDCPGCEVNFLQRVFEWTVQLFLSLKGSGGDQECGVQLSALLAELTKLPWSEHQWLCVDSVHLLVQICNSGDKEMWCWCARCVRTVSARTWLCVPEEHVAPHLAVLLHLFTTLPLNQTTLEETKLLPWWRLPQAALELALDRFFTENHTSSVPYHDLPQFSVVLAASELLPFPSRTGNELYSRERRLSAMSLWLRAACAPALLQHVPTYAKCVLNTLTRLACHLENSEGEIEELLSRAVLVMCMEPAASAALPKWEQWVGVCPAPMVEACVSATSVLTAFEPYAALADAAVRALLLLPDSSGWCSVRSRWQSCPWREAGPLTARRRLYAAYGTLLTHAHDAEALRSCFLGLLAADIDFVSEEVMSCVWACCACRVSRAHTHNLQEARTLLARWADEPRLSIIRMVSMRTQTDKPTPKLRLLCRLAQCILSTNEANVRAYESTCAAVLGSSPGEVAAWGRTPRPSQLPRLAMILFPSAEKYFKMEMNLASECTE